MLFVVGAIIFWCVSTVIEELWPVLKWIAFASLLMSPYFIWHNHAYPAMTDAEVLENLTVVQMISSNTDADGNKK